MATKYLVTYSVPRTFIGALLRVATLDRFTRPGKRAIRWFVLNVPPRLGKSVLFLHCCLRDSVDNDQLWMCADLSTSVIHLCDWDEGNEKGDHNEKSCATLSSPEIMEARSRKTMKRVCRACPDCQVPIQKNQGCEVMECKSDFYYGQYK